MKLHTTLKLLKLICSGLLLTACMGGGQFGNGNREGDQVEEVFKTRASLLNECITIGLTGNRDLATYFNVNADQEGFSEEYDTLNDFFNAKGPSLGGEGLGALNNENMLYFRTASHFAILLGTYLAANNAPELDDMKNLFLNLTAREMEEEEFQELQVLASEFDTDVQKKAAQFAAIVSSAEVQCL